MQILECTRTLAADLDESVTLLRDSGTQANVYAGVLEAADAALSNEDALGELRSATQQMLEYSVRLAEQLEASSRQVAALKAALDGIKVESLTDGLTGLANRRLFDETLIRRRRDAAEYGGDLCVALIDADRLTQLNERWGQALGDHVIRYIGAVLREHAQGDMLAARWSADDFALIAPRTHLSLAEALVARVARAVKSKQILLKSTGDKIAPVTISAGVVCVRGGRNRTGDYRARAPVCSPPKRRDAIASSPNLN